MHDVGKLSQLVWYWIFWLKFYIPQSSLGGTSYINEKSHFGQIGHFPHDVDNDQPNGDLQWKIMPGQSSLAQS